MNKTTWIIVAVVVVIVAILAVFLLGFPLGFYSSSSYIANTCIPAPGYTCSGVTLHNGNLTFTLTQLTGTAWLQSNIFIVTAGQTATAVPPLPCEQGVPGSWTSGQAVNVALSSYGNQNTCAGFTKSAGQTFSGTVYAGWKTSLNGTEYIAQVATITVKSS